MLHGFHMGVPTPGVWTPTTHPPLTVGQRPHEGAGVGWGGSGRGDGGGRGGAFAQGAPPNSWVCGQGAIRQGWYDSGVIPRGGGMILRFEKGGGFSDNGAQSSSFQAGLGGGERHGGSNNMRGGVTRGR